MDFLRYFGGEERPAIPTAVARDRQLQLAGIGDYGFAAVTVAVIAGVFLRRTAQIIVHLGVEHPLRQSLLQLVDQTSPGGGPQVGSSACHTESESGRANILTGDHRRNALNDRGAAQAGANSLTAIKWARPA
jgi:hypothetical protein